jgi:hypothetical protein
MRTFSIVLTAILFHTQLASAAGCDLPSFGGARLFRAASGSTYMAVADFNQDGIPDVVLGGSYTDSSRRPFQGISVLLGNGDGTFQPPIYYALQTIPNDVVVADFNGDGKPDLALSGGFGLMVMLGNGDGTFQAGIPNFANTTGIAVGDLNGDGIPDLVISDALRVLIGKGDGTFQPATFIFSATFASGKAVLGDFNGDGKLDVVVSSLIGGVVLLPGDGKGNLGDPVNFSTGESLPGKLAVADLNGDHKLDVVSVSPQDNKISVLLGNGNGTFAAPTVYASGGGPNSTYGVLLADLNGDGVPDIAVANQITSGASPTIWVFPGNGDGTFGTPAQYNPVAQAIWVLGAGDFNGDGLTDLVFTSSSDTLPLQMGVIFGGANGALGSPASYSVGPAPGQPVLADLNGDGVLDMVAPATGTRGNLSVLLGNGDGSFQPAVSYPSAAGAMFVAVGDFNGDGKPDLAVTTTSPTTFMSSLLIFLGNGDGSFQAPRSTPVMSGAFIVVGDFNKDGKLDLVVSGQVMLGNGDGTFRASSVTVTPFILAADMNGDGNLDMVGAGPNGSVSVQLGKGDGTFQAAVNYPIGKVGLVAVGDFNGDGKPDVVAISDPTVGTIAVLLNNGDGTLQPAVKYSVVPQGVFAVAVGDFNGDGAMDLGIASATSTVGAVTVLLGNGDGTFRDALNYGGGTPTRLTVGDVNGDGKPDLVTNGGPDSVTVLLNTYVPGSGGSACAPVVAVGN